MLPIDKVKLLAQWGYMVREVGREIYIEYITPTVAEAASNPSVGADRRLVVVKAVREGEVARIVEAYVEEPGGKRKMNLADLELWVEYIKNL